MEIQHCAITGITTMPDKVPMDLRDERFASAGKVFLLLEYLGPFPPAPRTAWTSWIEAANQLGAEGWELVQVADRQIWQGIEAWGLPAPPSTTFYPGKLLVMKRATPG